METVNELLEKYHAGREERIKALKSILVDELTNPQVQPGYPMWNGTKTYPNGKPITWCNRYVFNVLQRFGYSLDNYLVLNPYTGKPDKDWTSVNGFFELLLKYGRLRNPYTAQVCASYGVPAIIIQPGAGDDPGHVGIIYPDKEVFDDPLKIAVANAGSAEVMGIKSAYDCFYKWYKDPQYFTIEA